MYCPVCHSDYPADWKACPKDATHLLKSAQIGKYRIEGLLGVGGMGAVYRASNPDTKGRVAIKVMNPAVAGAESARARFQREAAAVAALRTTHVVKVYDFGTEPDGTLYLVMELMDGHALRDEIMPAPDYMDLARVQMVMEGALRGLAAAHRAGIVHRDLKPENVYVADTDDGEVPKLLDFGIARVRTRDQDLTRTGSLMGTASYMASEQIVANAGEIGPWSDVYAMGAILYEMLAGTPAYGGNTVTEVLQRVLKSESVPLASVRSGLPDTVYALVERCMSPEPIKRPQDAEAMRIALNAARLVPLGTQIPPPNKTRVDPVPSHLSPVGGDNVGMLATEGRDTPIPIGARTPPPGAYDQRNQILGAGGSSGAMAAAGGAAASGAMPVGGSGTVAVTPKLGAGTDAGAASRHPAAGASSGVGNAGGAIGTGDNLGAPTTGAPTKPRSKLPLVIGGVAVAVVGIAIVVVLSMKSGPAAAPDAQVIAAVPDAAAAPLDATQVAQAPDVADAVPDPVLELTKGMVAIPSGERDIGEDKPASPDALKRAHVKFPEFWIDREEMTLGALRTALKNAKAGGAPGDKPELPARGVTWAQADATCRALGKRLPTEAEWEIAALTTPREPKNAAMCSACLAGGSGKQVLLPTKRTDCSSDGLCDMLGGVVEWTAGAGAKATRIARGSSFTVAPVAGWEASIHFRVSADPKKPDPEIGFRCAFSREADLLTPKTGLSPSLAPIDSAKPPKPKPKPNGITP